MEATCKDCGTVENTTEKKGRWDWSQYFGKTYTCEVCNIKLIKLAKLARAKRKENKGKK